MSQGDLPSSVANLIVSTEPVFTAVIAFLLLGERMTSVQLFGAC
jgi:drug/metabolite transporter (DMT)-like permease